MICSSVQHAGDIRVLAQQQERLGVACAYGTVTANTSAARAAVLCGQRAQGSIDHSVGAVVGVGDRIVILVVCRQPFVEIGNFLVI